MNTTLIVVAVAAVLLILLVLWNLRTEKRLHQLLLGKNAGTLEDSINTLIKAVELGHRRQDAVDGRLKVIDEKLLRTIRNVATIRYNPFHDSGSNQSFASAFVNDRGDGVVISSLYSRERVSVFAKPVKAGTPEYELTEEENTALKTALGK